MIAASDVILSLRSRLRDLDEEKKYSEAELCDCINMAYAKIALELGTFAKTVEFDLAISSPSMPEEWSEILTASLEGKPLCVVPIDWFFKNAKTSKKRLISVKNRREIMLFPEAKEGILKIEYGFLKKISDSYDALDFPAHFMEAVAFYCMFLTLQNQPRTDSLQTAQWYLALFENELERARGYLRGALSTDGLVTEYQRI